MSAACSLATASASRIAFLSPRVGDDLPDDGAGDPFPAAVVIAPVFSTALTAVILAPSAAAGASLVVGEFVFAEAGGVEVGTPIESTLAFGASAPIEKTLAFGGGMFSAFTGAGAGAGVGCESPVGLLAMLIGGCRGCCCCGWKLPGPWLYAANCPP